MKMRLHILNFPDDSSVGELYLRKKEGGGKWKKYKIAQGQIKVPLDSEVKLSIIGGEEIDLTPLSTFGPDDIQILVIASTTRLNDADLQNLKHLTGLTGLGLWETSIGNDGINLLEKLSNLRWLDIGDTKVTDVGLSFLKEMLLLEELSLLNDQITENGLANIKKLIKLRRLDLMGTQVGDSSVKFLSKLKSLEYLRITDSKISLQACEKLRVSLPRCQIKYD